MFQISLPFACNYRPCFVYLVIVIAGFSPTSLLGFSSPLVAMNSNFVVVEEEYDFNGEKGGPSHYAYNERGELETKIFERSDGLVTVTSYEYLPNGSLNSSRRSYADGKTVDFFYTYDEAKRLIEKVFISSDGEEGFEKYSYDRSGRLTTALYRNVDFWLNGTITFAFDSQGHLEKGRFAGENGYDADLEFQTDDHGNVVVVIWNFSFGKKQTYRFGYRPLGSQVPPTDPGNHPLLVSALNEKAEPLEAGDPLKWTDADLDWLDRYASARILAFGEATHGTREFISARQRIFRYLVKHHGFRVLAVEGHFTESLFLDRCLRDANCNIKETMLDRMMIWTTQTQEMLALFEWMRSYNKDRPESQWVHYIGYDSQVQDHIVELLRELLEPAGPDIIAEVERAFLPFANLTRADYAQMNDRMLSEYRRRLDGLRTSLDEASLDTELGAYHAACALQLLEATSQSLEFLQQYFHHEKLVRDRHLTDNIAWVADLFGQNSKIMVWAHNAHIANHEGYALDAGGGMGWQLKRRFGDQYQCIAQLFSRGQFRAKVFDSDGEVSDNPRQVVFVVDPPPGSLNLLLEESDLDNFFLDLNTIDPTTDLGRWLGAKRAILGVGDLFLGYDKIDEYHYGGDRVMAPLSAFDAIIYLDEPHATTGLS